MKAPDWSELLGEWQALGQQWADWWLRGEALIASPGLETGNAALAVWTPAEVRIDPAAAAELTERYKSRFETLWSRALARASGQSVESERDEAPDRRFGARAWRDDPYFAWLKDAYRLNAEYLREVAELTQCDPATKRRVRFLARQYADA